MSSSRRPHASSENGRSLPAYSSRKRRLPWGYMVPLRDFNRAHSIRWNSTSTAFPSSAFLRPRRLAPRSTCRMYFNPTPRTGFSLQGFPLLARPYQLVAGLCPLGFALRNRYRRLPVRATIRSAALRALLHTRIHRPTPQCLAIAPVMIPSWDFPPPGSQLSHHEIA